MGESEDIVFIPKAGKVDYSNSKYLRAISLASFVLSTMERILDGYIRDLLHPRSDLSSSMAVCYQWDASKLEPYVQQGGPDDWAGLVLVVFIFILIRNHSLNMTCPDLLDYISMMDHYSSITLQYNIFTY